LTSNYREVKYIKIDYAAGPKNYLYKASPGLNYF
jgi:hypothetical protein